MGKLFFPRSEDCVPLYLLWGSVREGSRQAGANVDIPLGKRNLDIPGSQGIPEVIPQFAGQLRRLKDLFGPDEQLEIRLLLPKSLN